MPPGRAHAGRPASIPGQAKEDRGQSKGRKREAGHTVSIKEAEEALGTRDGSHAPQLRQQRLQQLQPVSPSQQAGEQGAFPSPPLLASREGRWPWVAGRKCTSPASAP